MRCPAVIECLDEAGEDLFTFLRFPKLQWKALRTTNALERINEEFRRRTKTQASFAQSGRRPALAVWPDALGADSPPSAGWLAGHARGEGGRLSRCSFKLNG